MGLSKTDLFTGAQIALAKEAKALAHPARVAIIYYLLKADQCINTHLVDELGLAQATISQHLKELKDIGIIQGNIEGARINYCINKARWVEIKNHFNDFFSQLPSAEKCC